MFHPNISPDGRVPLTYWSPAHDVTKILPDIQSLLSQPHLDSVLNLKAAQLYREDIREYARRWSRIIENSFDDPEAAEQYRQQYERRVEQTKSEAGRLASFC